MEQFTLTRDEGNHLKITHISSLSSAICPAAFVRHLNGDLVLLILNATNRDVKKKIGSKLLD